MPDRCQARFIALVMCSFYKNWVAAFALKIRVNEPSRFFTNNPFGTPPTPSIH